RLEGVGEVAVDPGQAREAVDLARQGPEPLVGQQVAQPQRPGKRLPQRLRGLPAGSTWWARSAIRNPTAMAGGGATTIRATAGYSTRRRARRSTPSIPGSSTATTTSQAAPARSRVSASAGDGHTEIRPSSS